SAYTCNVWLTRRNDSISSHSMYEKISRRQSSGNREMKSFLITLLPCPYPENSPGPIGLI
ncbi:hypothetical protein PFISCL1PPCAC_18073, partial [Pristionchus fissidentatus]